MNKRAIVRAVAIVVIMAAGLMTEIFATELTQITLAQKNTTVSAIQPNPQNAVSNTTTAADAKFLTYENSTLGIKIQYPSNWTKQTARGGIAFVVLPTGSNNNPEQFLTKLNVTGIMGFPPNVPLKAMADRVIDGYRHFLRNFQIESFANSTLGGDNAIKIVYRYTDPKNNSSFMATDIATVKSDRLYVIQYYAQLPRIQSYLPTLQKMVDSLQITG
jgi:eukaryotic-like serine/threonine-protein kinase